MTQSNNIQNSSTFPQRMTGHSINYSQRGGEVANRQLSPKSYTTISEMRHDKFGGYQTKASSKTSVKRTVYDLRKLN